MNYIAIMAGGVGSRFWPASTEDRPKQFLDITGTGKSLIRMTYDRFLKLVPAENILIVTNKKYKNLCLEHIPDLPEKNILCEPSRNNTGPCVAYTALHLQARHPEASFVIAPSDHIIAREDVFLEKIREALAYVADQDAIVTLGIEPTRPDTGYGYIETIPPLQPGINKVSSFKEKPDLATAKNYLEQGNYLWNGGIFIWKAKDVLRAFDTYTPEILQVLCQNTQKFGTPEEQDYIDTVYPNTPDISVDYAILEKADNVYTIPADIGWNDLGTWNSLHSYLPKDKNQNVLQGSIEAYEVTNSLIRTSPGKRVIIKGLDDFIVVENEEALLIYPKSDEQEIKKRVQGSGK